MFSMPVRGPMVVMILFSLFTVPAVAQDITLLDQTTQTIAKNPGVVPGAYSNSPLTANQGLTTQYGGYTFPQNYVDANGNPILYPGASTAQQGTSGLTIDPRQLPGGLTSLSGTGSIWDPYPSSGSYGSGSYTSGGFSTGSLFAGGLYPGGGSSSMGQSDWFGLGLAAVGLAGTIFSFIHDNNQYKLQKNQQENEYRIQMTALNNQKDVRIHELDTQLAAQRDTNKTQVDLATIQSHTQLEQQRIQSSTQLALQRDTNKTQVDLAKIQSRTQLQQQKTQLAYQDLPNQRDFDLKKTQMQYTQQQWLAQYQAAKTDKERQWLWANRDWLYQRGLLPGQSSDIDVRLWISPGTPAIPQASGTAPGKDVVGLVTPQAIPAYFGPDGKELATGPGGVYDELTRAFGLRNGFYPAEATVQR